MIRGFATKIKVNGQKVKVKMPVWLKGYVVPACGRQGLQNLLAVTL